MSTSTHKNKYLYKGVDSSVMVSKVRSTSPNILVKSDTDQTQGGVYETFCKGIALAWKTRYCRKKESQATQRREIEVLKRLDHRHVVRLVGSYTQGPELGLLIWPVAICDLGAFMDDIDTLHGNMSRLEMPDDDDCRQVLSIGGRFDVLCHRNDCATTAHGAGIARLLASFGCLIGAIRYIHDQKVRHKDIKPQNILLSHDGLWLADFGISSDFSTLSSSETETGERGTFRYCAPEVASYARSGRPADIFSLGCIFLEMLALVKGVRLAELRAHCPEHRGAFHKNLKHQQTWFTLLKTRVPHLQHLLCEVENMLEERPHRRPTAPTLESRFWIINKLANTSSTPLYDPCCEFEQVTSEIPRLQSEIRELKEQIDQLRGSPHNTDLPSYSTLPPPPMGPNLGAVVLSAQTTHHSNSNSNPREKCSRTRRKQADMPVRWS